MSEYCFLQYKSKNPDMSKYCFLQCNSKNPDMSRYFYCNVHFKKLDMRHLEDHNPKEKRNWYGIGHA